MRSNTAAQSYRLSSLAWRSVEIITAFAAAATVAVASAVELPGELRHPQCVACQQPAGAARALFSEADWRRLENAEVVIVERRPTVADGDDDSFVSESEAAVIVPRPAAEVWAVLADFESRPEFLPNISESRVQRVEDTRVWISQHVRVLWMQIRYTLIMTLDPARGLMTSVLDRASPHDIRDSHGSWDILPHGDASALLMSRSRVETGMPVPGFIESYLVKNSLPQMMTRLRDEVERRAKASASVR